MKPYGSRTMTTKRASGSASEMRSIQFRWCGVFSTARRFPSAPRTAPHSAVKSLPGVAPIRRVVHASLSRAAKPSGVTWRNDPGPPPDISRTQ
jgi:hypothetical protein